MSPDARLYHFFHTSSMCGSMCVLCFSVCVRMCACVSVCTGGLGTASWFWWPVASPLHLPVEKAQVFSLIALSLFLSTRKWHPSTPPRPKEWRPVVSRRLTHQQIRPWPHLRTPLFVSIFLFLIFKNWVKMLLFRELWCNIRCVITYDRRPNCDCIMVGYTSLKQTTEAARWLMQCGVPFVLWDKHLAESCFWKLDCSLLDKAASLAGF